MATVRRRMTGGFTLVELLVVILIIGILMSVLLVALSYIREAARVAKCKSHIRQIASAALQYESANRRLPPGWLGPKPPAEVGPFTEQFVGVLAYLLPHLEEGDAYDLVKVEKNPTASGPPWWTDLSTVNAAKQDIPIFVCPSVDPGPPGVGTFLSLTTWHDPDEHLYWITGAYVTVQNNAAELGTTNYMGCMGYVGVVNHKPGDALKGIFYNRSTEPSSSATDGLTHTIMFGEALGKNRGLDIKYSWMGCGAMLTAFGIDQDHFASFSSNHATQVMCCMMDGRVVAINKEVSDDMLTAAGAMADGKTPTVEDGVMQ